MTNLYAQTVASLSIISDEYHNLNESDKSLVARDALAAFNEDGCLVSEYLARIGTGNLASYVSCLKAGAR